MEADHSPQETEVRDLGGFAALGRRACAYLPRREVLIGTGLILLTIAVYIPALDSLMVADDFRIVDQVSFGDALRSLHDTVGYGRNEYRPVVAFSYAVSNWLWHGSLRGLHFDSILLHALNVVLLFSWLLLLTRSCAISAMAAVIFAVHPVHDSRVVWIAARDSLLSTLFTFLALITYTSARRRDDGGSASSRRSVRVLNGLSAIFILLSLLSYEGAAVVPGIAAAMEFFFFARAGQGFRARLRMTAANTIRPAIVLLFYLAWWVVLFRGQIGQYDLSFDPGNLLRNYYSLGYELFHGNARIAGILYFLLLIPAFVLPRKYRPLAAFSILIMLLSFLPFVIISGFAGRFAYASAAGYATLIALPLCACAAREPAGFRPAWRFAGPSFAALVFLVLAGYYVVDLRARIAEWRTAGQIAQSIPRQIKELYPDLPDGAQLVLARVPRMYGHAYVYPIALESSIARLYPGRNLRVIYGPGELTRIVEEAGLEGPDVFYFNYYTGPQGLEEIVALQK